LQHQKPKKGEWGEGDVGLKKRREGYPCKKEGFGGGIEGLEEKKDNERERRGGVREREIMRDLRVLPCPRGKEKKTSTKKPEGSGKTHKERSHNNKTL